MVYVIQVCWQLAISRIRTELQFHLLLAAVSKPVWHIPLLCVQWKTPDDGQRHCPKHVEFYSKNIFEKLEHLFGFYYKNWTQSGVIVCLRPPSTTSPLELPDGLYDIWYQSANRTMCCSSDFHTAGRHRCKWNIQEQSEWSAVCFLIWIQSMPIP